MFSPILPMRSARVCSTDLPFKSNAPNAATSAGFCSATNFAEPFANARKSSFFATKSVSELTSTIAPVVPLTYTATTPSAAMREAALPALLPNFTRKISSALPMSPAASVRAFLHSIIGASVLPRNSATIPAVIVVIFYPLFETSYDFIAIT